MYPISFRLANIADLPRIVELYNATIPSRMVTAEMSPVTVASKEAWFLNHDAESRPLWVMEDDTQHIVGWLSFQSFYGRPAYNKTVEISIYLDEKVRGKGLGGLSLTFAVEQAQQRGITNILGFIFEHNIPSIKLFQKYGFSKWGLFPNIAQMDEELYSLAVLGKSL